MSEPASKTKILQAAKELFLSRGYAATTVDAICEKAGLTKGSFYYFFDAKEELGLAVMAWSLEQSRQMLEEGPHQAVTDPVQHCLAYLEHIEDCAMKLWGSGCLLGSFALELADENDQMQKAISAMFQAVTDAFAEKLEPVVAACPPDSVGSALELSEQFFGSLEGSIILAKAHRDWKRLPATIRTFRVLLSSHLPLPV